jgi:hypothetical protein
MRIASSLLALTLMMLLSAPADAQTRRQKRYDNGNDSSSAYRTYDGRSTTVDRQGLCVRDNGRPLNSLNLNHECDREEFWARMRDRGRSFR